MGLSNNSGIPTTIGGVLQPGIYNYMDPNTLAVTKPLPTAASPLDYFMDPERIPSLTPTSTSSSTTGPSAALTNYLNPTTITALNTLFSNPGSLAPTTVSSSATGLSPEVNAAMIKYLTQSTQNLTGYQNVLGQLSSPQSFMAAYKPVYEQMLQSAINGLNNKGMINSTVAKGAIGDVGNEVTSKYLQQLMQIAGLYGTAANMPTSIADVLKSSTSGSVATDPLAAYKTIADLFTTPTSTSTVTSTDPMAYPTWLTNLLSKMNPTNANLVG